MKAEGGRLKEGNEALGHGGTEGGGKPHFAPGQGYEGWRADAASTEGELCELLTAREEFVEGIVDKLELDMGEEAGPLQTVMKVLAAKVAGIGFDAGVKHVVEQRRKLTGKAARGGKHEG